MDDLVQRGPRSGVRALDQLLRATSPEAFSSSAASEILSRFIEQTLGAYARQKQRLIELWVRLSHHTRALPAWTYFGPGPPPAQPGLDDATILCELVESDGPALLASPGPPERWVVLAGIGRWSWRWGDLIAVFEDRQQAASAIVDIVHLVADMELGVRLLRRAVDRDALGQLAFVLTGVRGAERVLRSMAEIVRDHMASDGAEVYALKQTDAGRALVQLCRTDPKDAARARADWLGGWVVDNDDWMIIPDSATPERTEKGHVIAITGRHGWVHIPSPRASDAIEEPRSPGYDGGYARQAGLCPHTPGRERSLLLVPMHRQGRVAGVLSVFRLSGDAYEMELDTASLLALAPQVVSACKQVLQIERLEEEMTAVSRLADLLVPATSLASAYESISTEIGRLARAKTSLLLHHDPRRPGHLYISHAWTADLRDVAALRALLGGFHEDCGSQHDQWERRVAEAIAARVAGTGMEHVAGGALIAFPSGEDGLPRAALWVSSPRGDKLDHVSPAFARYVDAMLENHVRVHASSVVGAMGGPLETDAADHLEVLQRAARLLKEATFGEAALVYSGEPGRMKVSHCFPPAPSAIGLLAAKGSLTWESIQKAESRRVLDASDERDAMAARLDRTSLERVLSAFHWTGVRSWICCPVVHDGRCVGAIKVLTSDAGRFLGAHQEIIAQAVADRAALEIHKMSRALMLEALNDLTDDLVSKGGGELADAMLGALRGWIDRFVRPSCELAIFARVPDRTLIFRCTSGLDEKAAQALDALSRTLGRKAARFGADAPRHSVGLADAGSVPPAGVAAPIVLAGQHRLEGHLFVLHSRSFSQTDESLIREAAREIAILLNGERLRHEWTLNAGLFRHALLGPVQGLTSAARMLGIRAEEAGANVAELRVRVDEEAEIIRVWRENQRLYLGGKAEIRPRPQDLRPVVARCLDRYREPLKARRITLHEEWKAQGALHFPFDEQAVDLALSNLLDNARKYTFFNREVTVGVRVYGAVVQIWVEDVGHPIPERLEIYREGKRMDWTDPFRVISGEGLGLPMARAVIEQHEGQVYHTSERDGRGASDGTTPHRVRFTMELPHHWNRRKKHG